MTKIKITKNDETLFKKIHEALENLRVASAESLVKYKNHVVNETVELMLENDDDKHTEQIARMERRVLELDLMISLKKTGAI